MDCLLRAKRKRSGNEDLKVTSYVIKDFQWSFIALRVEYDAAFLQRAEGPEIVYELPDYYLTSGFLRKELERAIDKLFGVVGSGSVHLDLLGFSESQQRALVRVPTHYLMAVRAALTCHVLKQRSRSFGRVVQGKFRVLDSGNNFVAICLANQLHNDS